MSPFSAPYSQRKVGIWGISGRRAVLVFCCCCDTSPQTWWLKTTHICRLTVLEGGSPKMDLPELKSRNGQGCVPLRGSGEESGSLPFSVCRGGSDSLAHGSFLLLQSQQWRHESLSHSVTPTLTVLPPPSTWKDSCGHTGPTWITQASLLIFRSVA